MYRKLRGGFRSDDGMSVLEVVFAAFILFFVLTAILGLVATNTQMGLRAKQRTAAANAVASHLEWMRSLPFDEMAIRGTTLEAVVDAQTVLAEGDFTVTIDTEIQDSTSGTKQVRITAVATAPGFDPMTISSTSIVRDAEAGITQLVSGSQGPEIVFSSATPEPDAVVYGAYLHGGAPLYLGLHADTENPGVITELRMYCEGTLLRDGTTTYSTAAAWTPGVNPADVTFRWDTRQLNDDGVKAIPDGWRLVRAIAKDDSGLQSTVERRFYVDNFPPGNPGVPTAVVYTDVESRISWTAAQDGTDPAVKYLVRTRKVNADGTLGDYVETIVTSAVHLQTTTPFSRYTAAVAASSPRNQTTAFFDVAKPYVSRTKATGTSKTVYAGSNNKRTATVTVNLSTTTPSFAVSSIRYDLYRSTSAATIQSGTAYKTNVSPTSYAETYVEACGKNDPTAYYYAYKVTFTPSGYAGGTPESVWSNVVGPTTALGNTVIPMAHVSW